MSLSYHFSNPQLSQAMLIAGYDAAAPEWHGRMQRLGYLAAYTRLFQSLPLSPERVLDCGIGTGALSAALLRARRYQRPPHLHGVDISSGMVAQARRVLNREGVAAAVQCADGRTLPYGRATFDLIMSAHMLEHLPDPRTALAEFGRVLTADGHLLLIISRPSPISAVIQRRWGHACYDLAACDQLLHEVGFQPLHYLPLIAGLARFTSLAILAAKASQAEWHKSEQKVSKVWA